MAHTRLILKLACFLFLGMTIHAQSTSPGVRIEVNRDGLYEVTWNDIAHLVNGRPLNSERMRLMKGRLETPMTFRSLNGGRFDRSSSFIFYGEASASPYSKNGVYHLEFKPRTNRIRVYRPRPTAETLKECFLEQEFEKDLIYDPMKTVRADLLDLKREDRTHWFWARIPPAVNKPGSPTKNFASFLLHTSPRPRPVDKVQAKLVVRLRGPASQSAKQEMVCELAGKFVGRKTWVGGNQIEVSFDVPTELVKSATVLTIRNVSRQVTWKDKGNQVNPIRRNDLLVDSVSLTYKTLLTGPTTKQPQILYQLHVPQASSSVGLHFVGVGTRRNRFYDVNRRAWLEGSTVDCSPQKIKKIIAVSFDGYFKPAKLSAWTKRDLRGETAGADWVCITLERHKPYLSALVDLRHSQGLKTMVVTDREIYDSFNNGVFSPLAIRDFLTAASATWKTRPRYILLVGDADRDVDWHSEKPVLPTMETMTYYNGETSSDAAFLPKDSQSMSIGRFPARREDEVLKMVKRTVDYETKPITGPWNKRLNFIASEGRFGPVVDALLENYARKILTHVIPASYDVTMTYANRNSKYLYPPAEFNKKVIERLNEGSLVYTYMGHGYPRGFDRLRIGKKRFPILDIRDVPQVDAGFASPLMTIVACSTAHFDNPDRDSIGEELMRRTHGPLALIGSTRISHPFANSLLSKSLLAGLFKEDGRTIGEVLRSAQQFIVSDWRKDPMSQIAGSLTKGLDIDRLMKDHQHMYVLFGDPATRLRKPIPSITLNAQETANPGDTIIIQGATEMKADEDVWVTIEAKRDRIIFPLAQVKPGQEGQDELIKKNYQAANHKVVAHGKTIVKDGKFSINLVLPSSLSPGDYFIKAFIAGQEKTQSGSKSLTVPQLNGK